MNFRKLKVLAWEGKSEPEIFGRGLRFDFESKVEWNS